MDTKNIFPVWQPIGCSTHLISQRIGEKFGVKASHTGTLDPMAEGVIIILLGEDRFKKYEFANWVKGYEFEITLGISTDTFDGLGLMTGMDVNEKTRSVMTNIINDTNNLSFPQVQEILKTFIGKYEQTVPVYSTKKIKGKHLHEYARENQAVALPTKKGEIYSLELRQIFQKPIDKVVQENFQKIEKVSGDFRQNEIMTNWRTATEKYLNNSKYTATVIRLYVETSKGLYVRSLSQDICQKLSTIGFVNSIARLKNGNFHKTDCITPS